MKLTEAAWAALALFATSCFDFGRAVDQCIDNAGCATVKRFKVHADAGPGSLADFPLLVALNASRVDYHWVKSPRTQLRFFDEAGAPLDFEVDHWNPKGESDLWVHVPALPADGEYGVQMYMAAADDVPDAGLVWPGFEAVHHFDGTLSSADPMRYEGVAGATLKHGGIVGDAVWFADGGALRYDFAGAGALFDGWSAFTLSFWIFPDYGDATQLGGQPDVAGKGAGGLTDGRLFVTGTDVELQIDAHFTGANDVYSPQPLALRQWNQVVYTFDGSELRVYLNGARAAAHPMAGGPQTLLPSASEFRLGGNASSFVGEIDELRIERRAHDDLWVAAEYRTLQRSWVRFDGE